MELILPDTVLPWTLWLKIQNLFHTFHREDVVVAFHPFTKPEPLEQLTQSRKRDVCVRTPGKDELVEFSDSIHGLHKPECQKSVLVSSNSLPPSVH